MLALKTEERPPTNYPHPLRFREPDAKERTKWWWYYQVGEQSLGCNVGCVSTPRTVYHVHARY